tara:strand:+ start:57 stop:911 length:855 start_codon:yes stop_codon:yes gene_type:complete
MSRPNRYYLAKSADSGRCGNKAGLPSTVGVSLAHRRAFKMSGKGCCKNDLPDGCRGPTDRKRAPDNTVVRVTLTPTYDYSNTTITVTLSGGLPSKVLSGADFTIPTGLTFGTGTATTATFTHTGLANTLVPGKEFTITLKADKVKNAAGKFLSTATTTQQVNSSTKIKILSLDATNNIAIVQFDNYVSTATNGELAVANFGVMVGSVAAVTPTLLTFIGDQVGGQTYQFSTTLTTGNQITIKPINVYQTVGGVTVVADDAGILGQGYPAATTATTSSANPRTVA